MTRLQWTFTIIALLLASPVSAQTPDHTDVIRAAKASAIAAGIDVDSSECARFEVTKRAAVLLAGDGAGLLSKPSGNNCEGYAVDVIAYPSGTIFDVLGAGDEGPATPHWMELTPVSPDRWRAPRDLVTTPPARPATPSPEPPAARADPDVALARIEAQIAALRTELADFQAADQREHQTTRDAIKAFRDAAGSALKQLLAYVPAIVSSLGLLKK